MGVSSIFRAVLFSSLTGSIVAAMILLAKLLLRKRMSFKLHYYIWFLLIIRLIIPYAPQSPMSVYNLFNLPDQKANVLQLDISYNDVSNMHEQVPSQNSSSAAETSPADMDTKDTAPVQKQPGTAGSSFNFGSEAIGIIWIVVAAVLLIYMIAVNIRFRIRFGKNGRCTDSDILRIFDGCKCMMNIRSDVSIIYDSSIKVPFLMGFIKPKLLIPLHMIDGLSDSEKRYVFLHELGHLKRKDILVNWLMVVLQAVNWFNPVIWYSFYRMRDDCEVACDSLALSYLEPGEQRSYGEAVINLLRDISKPGYRPGVAGMAGHASSVKRRISAIMDIKKISFKWYIVAAAAILLIGCTGLTSSQTGSAARNNPGVNQVDPSAAPQVSEDQEDGAALFSKDNEFLLRALSRNIKKDPAKITSSDLQDVTTFFIHDDIKNDLKDNGFSLDKAYDFSLLQEMPNLESLQINGIKLKDYGVLKNLPKLASLGISYLDDTNAKIVGGIKTLTGISIEDSAITSIDFLSNCSSLWYLSLKNTPDVKDFKVLKSLGQLKYLELNSLKLNGNKLAELPDMEKLETLRLNGNNIKSVSSLPSMPTLYEMYLDGNPVESVSIPVDKVPKLGFLSLQNTPINSLDKIKGMDILYELDIRGTQIKYVAPLSDMKKNGGLKNFQTIYIFKKDILDLDTLKDTGIGVLETKLG